jgi:hypothetical protein
MVLFAIMHLRFMSKPPVGHHVWRQAFTSSVALNFYQEDMNVLKPRVSNRGLQDGVTGMQFPLYEWCCAVIFRLFGFNESVFRWFSMSLLFIGVLFFYRFGIRRFGGVAGLIGAMVLLWSPELYYHGINALPDVMALTFALIALERFDHFCMKDSKWSLVIAYICLALAGLVKLQYLMFGAMFLTPLIKHQWSNFKRSDWWLHILSSAIVLTAVLAWYWYADILRSQSDLKDVGLYTTPVKSFEEGIQAILDIIIMDMTEMFFGFAGVVTFIFGLIYGIFKSRKSVAGIIGWLLTAVVFGIYFYFELGQFKHHGYYLIPMIVLLVSLVSYGWKEMSPRWKLIVLVLVFIQPVFSSIRIDHRWKNPSTGLQPLALYDESFRENIIRQIPDNALTLVGPDLSGSIYFYLTQTDGTCGFNETDFFEKWKMRDSLKIEYAITPCHLESTEATLLFQNDGMHVYQVLSKNH